MAIARTKLGEIEAATATPQLLILGEIDIHTCIISGRVLRKLGVAPRLDVIVESPGGDLDAAVKLIKMLRVHCANLSVVVPFYAKSAASLIVIGANRIVVGAYGEVGPMDPQIRDPQSRVGLIPAHSILQALKFIEGTEDNLVKLALTDKLSPLLIGAFQESERATKQEVEEFCKHLKDSRRAVERLTSYYLSHGYPLTGDALKDLGFPVEQLSLVTSEPYMELHDIYVRLSHIHEHTEDDVCLAPDVAVTKDYQVAFLNGKIICEKLTPVPAISPPTPGASTDAHQ